MVQNKRIIKFYRCKMGQGEWVWLHFVGVLRRVTHWSSQVTPAPGCPNFQLRDYDGEDSTSSKVIHSVS